MMKRFVLLLLCAALALNCLGCVWFIREEEEPLAVNEAPSPTTTPQNTESGSSSAQNPVSLFYTNYYSACEALEDLCKSRLESDAAKEAADTLVYLADHDMNVSEGRATFGWLLSTDTENYFASSVFSAASGSGSISILQDQPEAESTPGLSDDTDSVDLPDIETVESSPLLMADDEDAPLEYTLSFEYGTGRSLTGTLLQNRLRYSSAGSTAATTEIIFEDNVWMSTVSRSDGIVTTLRCDEAGFHFSVSRVNSKKDEPESVYSWTSDSSGLKNNFIAQEAA